MLACHNYWHWALYLIEKVRRHPGSLLLCPLPLAPWSTDVCARVFIITRGYFSL